MTKIHYLNVKQGDCILLEHPSNRLTMFDICAGNLGITANIVSEILFKASITPARGNFQMCKHPTNPLDYVAEKIGKKDIWRFILSHPDMDHLDGFNALLDQFHVQHFWHSGAKKDKPDFSGGSGYKEEDWDRYQMVIDNEEEGTKLVDVQAGDKFKYANRDDEGGVGDNLHILAPDSDLIAEANRTQEFNDASYVVLFESEIGKVLLTGDAHDKTWEYIEENYKEEASDVTLLIAPHHGRKSGRSYKFLDFVNPKLTLFGCAPSDNLAYDAWNRRGLIHIQNNQCGCIVAEGYVFMEIYVENESFAAKSGGNVLKKNAQGFYYLGHV